MRTLAVQLTSRAASFLGPPTSAFYTQVRHQSGLNTKPSPKGPARPIGNAGIDRSNIVMAAAANDSAPVVDKATYDADWSTKWQGLDKGQGWDKSGSAPSFTQLLSTGELQIAGKRCIVPGCGRGYDVFEFAKSGAAVSVGLDLVDTAIEAAKQEQQHYELTPEATAAVQLVQGDWFSWMPADKELFDIGYDYTFGCAMHPSMRTSWAEGWQRLLKPGATLVTLIFPVDATMDPLTGPPFPITPELYKGLLGDLGLKLLRLEQVPAELSLPGRAGREWLALWQR